MNETRPYRTEDEARVLELWWDSWHSIQPELSHPQTRDGWRQRWLDEIVPRQEVVVVTDDKGIIAGFAAADLVASELTQIFVAPTHKRRGFGRALLTWAETRMRGGFRLRTLVQNVASRTFYEKHGLVEGMTAISPVNGMETIEYRWASSRAVSPNPTDGDSGGR
jgi:putative acetyltransferase